MTRWERLEDWLFNTGKTAFTADEYAKDLGEPVPEATTDIQSYLAAQRTRFHWAEDKDGKPVKKGGSKTLFVIHRRPGTRTTNAVWEVGHSVRDARLVGNGFSDDVRRKVLRAFQPDLLRIGEKNSRARQQVEAQISSVVDHAIAILELASQGRYNEDEDEA